ncbi:glycogen synthase [Desulfolithobacter sp.]
MTESNKKRSTKVWPRIVWMVTREYDGLAGAGGVKDVCRQLARTLAGEVGVEVRVILPRYGFMKPGRLGFKPLDLPRRDLLPCRGAFRNLFEVDMNYVAEERRETVSFWHRELEGVQVYLVEAERYQEKLGVYTYTAEEEEQDGWKKQGMGHYDYFAMNILLQKSGLALMIVLGEAPDVIHCHDGHAATLAAMMRENEGFRHFFRHTGVVVTIHNAGLGYHQEVDDLPFARAVTGLPEHVVLASRLGSSFDPFMAAAEYAVLNTVSENYARELQETNEDARTGWLGHRLLQRGVRLAGVTNGIDPQAFSPREPEKLGLAAGFDPLAGDLAGKRVCKEYILKRLARIRKHGHVLQHGTLKRDAEIPLCTFIGRLTEQKGVDVLLAAVAPLMDKDPDFQLLLLGSGDPALEEELHRHTVSRALAGRICFLEGYDPDLANKIYAAGDFFLIPSLYEPCGLTDYIAQLLGNLPIVHHVGGLVKVVDGKTGFAYREHSSAALARTMERALELYRTSPKKIRTMQKNAVKRIHARHTWSQVIRKYRTLYVESMKLACRH